MKKTFTVCLTVLVMLLVHRATAQCALTYSYAFNGNGTTVFTLTAQNQSTASVYIWQFGSTTYSATGSPTAATVYTAAGVQTITALYSTGTCSNAVTFTIMVPPCNGTVAYTWTSNGGKYSFSNLSTPLANTKWIWEFSNGFKSNAVHPSYTFTAPGIYTVTLTSESTVAPFCVGVQISTIQVSCVLNAGFTYSSMPNGQIIFFNTSTDTLPGTTYTWSFGNSNASYFVQPPVQSYTANGYVIASLIATNNGSCSSTYTTLVHINTICGNLQALFSHTTTINGVELLDISVGNVNYRRWRLGDTSQEKSAPYVTHTYATEGLYTIRLLVRDTNTWRMCDDSISQKLYISAGCNFYSAFTHTAVANGKVHFTDRSIKNSSSGALYYWDFGDGTYSRDKDPTHDYRFGGTHYVSHVVLRKDDTAACYSANTLALNITSAPCGADAGFKLEKSGQGKDWRIIPNYMWNVASASWDWGDGTKTDSLYPRHVYKSAGNYDICLTVTTSCGAVHKACSGYTVYQSASDMVSVNVVRPQSSPVSVQERASLAGPLQVYPNPADDVLHVKIPASAAPCIIALYTIAGEKIMTAESGQSGAADHNIDISAMAPGLYLVELTGNDGSLFSKLIISR